MKKMKTIYKNIFLLILIGYVVYTVISQQKVLNSYRAEEQRYSAQIEEQKEEQEQLKATKANIHSEEYVESIAREKLNMYLPNERVYIDMSK